MKNRIISSIGLSVIFLMCIIPPNQLTVGRLVMMGGFLGVLYGLLCFAIFFASLAGVAILITTLMKKDVIPVIVDFIAAIIAGAFVLFRFIAGGGLANFYVPTTYFFIAGAVLALLFTFKSRNA